MKKKDGDITPAEARAYLESRSRRTRHDWAAIFRRIVSDGESQEAVGRDLGVSSAMISAGLRRYAERIANVTPEGKK